jgi:hypothetical protein
MIWVCLVELFKVVVRWRRILEVVSALVYIRVTRTEAMYELKLRVERKGSVLCVRRAEQARTR